MVSRACRSSEPVAAERRALPRADRGGRGFSCLTCFKDPTASDLRVSCVRVATLRRVPGVVEQCAVARLQPCGGGERFCGAVVAPIAGMGTAGDLQPDPVSAPELVRDGPKIKLGGMWGVQCGIGQAQDPVGEVDRLAAWGDVTEAGVQVNVRHRCLHVQLDPHRADHLQIGGFGIAGEGKNIRSGFEAAVVGGASGQATAVPAMDGVGSAGS